MPSKINAVDELVAARDVSLMSMWRRGCVHRPRNDGAGVASQNPNQQKRNSRSRIELEDFKTAMLRRAMAQRKQLAPADTDAP